jgi:hypothetical protein
MAGDTSGGRSGKGMVARVVTGNTPHKGAPNTALRRGRARHHQACRKSDDDGCTGNTHCYPPELLFAIQRMMGGFDQIKSVARSG